MVQVDKKNREMIFADLNVYFNGVDNLSQRLRTFHVDFQRNSQCTFVFPQHLSATIELQDCVKENKEDLSKVIDSIAKALPSEAGLKQDKLKHILKFCSQAVTQRYFFDFLLTDISKVLGISSMPSIQQSLQNNYTVRFISGDKAQITNKLAIKSIRFPENNDRVLVCQNGRHNSFELSFIVDLNTGQVDKIQKFQKPDLSKYRDANYVSLADKVKGLLNKAIVFIVYLVTLPFYAISKLINHYLQQKPSQNTPIIVNCPQPQTSSIEQASQDSNRDAANANSSQACAEPVRPVEARLYRETMEREASRRWCEQTGKSLTVGPVR